MIVLVLKPFTVQLELIQVSLSRSLVVASPKSDDISLTGNH